MGRETDEHLARQGRIAALVIAGAMVFWIAAQWIGSELGMAVRYAVLIDLAVLAAFVWALVITFQIWRARRNKQG